MDQAQQEQQLPLRLSSSPQKMENPKTPQKGEDLRHLTPNWKQVQHARTVSEEKTKHFVEENAKELDTPTQRFRVVSSKMEELRAKHELANTEAENFSETAELLKRTRPEDDSEYEEMLEKMRKKRRTAATYLQMYQELQNERATFVESAGSGGAAYREEILEILLSIPTSKARKSDSRNTNWKNRLVNFYNAGRPGYTKLRGKEPNQITVFTEVWCPVFARYFPSDQITAAHLAPHSLTADLIRHLTGTDEATSTTIMGNGILLHTFIEEQLDKGGIVLIPDDRDANPIELKLAIVGEGIRNKPYSTGNETWDALDGRLLQFKNAARPQKRFLYLRYAMTMIYAYRFKLPGHEALRERVWPSRLIWASPGKYLRQSALASVGGIIGEHFDGTFGDDDIYPAFTPEVSQNLNEKFRAILDSEMNRDEDDDDDDDDE